MLVMNGVHNIVRQTYILKKNVEISTLSKGITHGRGFESKRPEFYSGGPTCITHVRGFESSHHLREDHSDLRITHVRGFESYGEWLDGSLVELYHPRTWV